MSRAERLDRFIRQSTPVLLVGLILFLVTSVGTLIALGQGGWSWYDHKYRWRIAEYRRLHTLHAGYTERKFEQALGTPAFHESSDDRRWTEKTFRGRGYWLQTVTRRGSNAVAFFAVTSCSKSFNPTFRLPDGTRITLNKSTLASVDVPNATADYFAPAATANAHFYDILAGGNPENYKSFAWGFNDPCLNMKPWSGFMNQRTYQALDFGTYRGSTGGGPAPIQALRRRLPVNTYAETAPTVRFADGAREFRVGPDRILIRTVTQVVSTSYDGSPQPPPTDAERFGARLTPRQREVAYCVTSPLVLDASVTAGANPYGVPAFGGSLRTYVGNRFLHVFVFSPNPSRRQEVILFFAKNDRSAIRVASAIAARERGVVRRRRDVVQLWITKPTRVEEEAVNDCM